MQTQFDVGPEPQGPMTPVAPPSCARCGTEVTTAWAYCETCGASIRIEELAAALTPVGEMSDDRAAFNGLALTSIVLAVLWMGGLGSLLAVVTGRMAKSRIRDRRQRGEGLATAGVALGVAGLALVGYLLAAS